MGGGGKALTPPSLRFGLPLSRRAVPTGEGSACLARAAGQAGGGEGLFDTLRRLAR